MSQELEAMVKEKFGATSEEIQKAIEANRAEAKAELDYEAKHNAGRSPLAGLDMPERKQVMGRMLHALGQAKGDPSRARKIAKGDGIVEKALGTLTVSGGGALVETEMANDFIAALRDDALVGRLGARSMSMPTGHLQIGGIGTGATAAYAGEGSAATYSQPTTRSLELKSHRLAIKAAVENDFLRGGASNGQYIMDDLVAAGVAKMDSTFMRGDGSVNQPVGLRNLMASGNAADAANTAGTAGGETLAEINQDLVDLMAKIMASDAKVVAPRFVGALRTYWGLYGKTTTTGDYAFKDLRDTGRLMGVPLTAVSTGIIPTDLADAAAGTQGTEFYLFDAFHAIVGEVEGMTIKVSDEATYTDASGNKQSCIENDQTLYVIQMKHDFGLRHDTKAARKDKVTWGL